MLKPSGRVILPCACGCCNLVFERGGFEDGEAVFNVSIQAPWYGRKAVGVWNRVRGAVRTLFGKPAYCNNVRIGNKVEFSNLIDDLAELLEG